MLNLTCPEVSHLLKNAVFKCLAIFVKNSLPYVMNNFSVMKKLVRGNNERIEKLHTEDPDNYSSPDIGINK